MKELNEQEKREKCFAIFDKVLKNNADNTLDTVVDSATNNVECLFDYCISNPPYQQEVGKKKKNTGNRTSIDIFPLFHKYAAYYSDNIVMIYPATWQKSIQAGHGKWLINNGLKSSNNYLAKDVFGNSIEASIMLSVLSTEINYDKDISINNTYRSREIPAWINNDKDFVFYEKTRNWDKGYLSGAVFMTKLSNLQDNNIPLKVDEDNEDNIANIYIKRKPGKQADADFFTVKEDDISDYVVEASEHYDFDKYNVVIQSAVFGRQSVFDRMIRQIGTIQARVLEKKTTAGLTLASLRSFDTKEEATNFAMYMNSKIVSSLLYFDYSRKTFASFVPDLGDYTYNNPDIDWSQPLDPQLYQLFNLTDEEINIINNSK